MAESTEPASERAVNTLVLTSPQAFAVWTLINRHLRTATPPTNVADRALFHEQRSHLIQARDALAQIHDGRLAVWHDTTYTLPTTRQEGVTFPPTTHLHTLLKGGTRPDGVNFREGGQ